MKHSRAILIHSFSGLMGGSERILLDLAIRSERQVILACPPGPLADLAEADDIAVLRLEPVDLDARGFKATARAIGSMRRHGRRVGRIARDIDPLCIVAWGMRSAISLWLGRVGKRNRVIAEHVDLLPDGRRGSLTRRALMSADHVIALSEAIARDLDPSLEARESITVIHPGVPMPADPPGQRRQPALALCLAALEPWKGQHLLVEALAETEGVELVLAGSSLTAAGEIYSAAIRRAIERTGLSDRVSLPGPIEPAAGLADATMLVHPTAAEPFGRAIVEALAAGRPVIAVNNAGPREIVTEDCGFLVEPEDVGGLARAMTALANNPGLAARMGSAGRRRVAGLFDPERQASSWQGVLTSVTGQDGDRRWRTRLDATEAPEEAAATSPAPSANGEDLTIITVIHDSAAELSRLLASVRRHLPAASVVVVDSGSSDGGAGLAAEWPGPMNVIELDGNRGYGAGNNAGLELVRTRFTALVNPDVELIDDSLARLAARLEADDGGRLLLAPLLIHPDGRRQDGVHPEPGTAPEAVRSLIPAGLLPKRVGSLIEPHRLERPARVGWAVGACIVARTETLRSLGPFDADVHLYAEDLDLCLRAADAGIETWFHPETRVLHREAHSTVRRFGGEPARLLALRRRAVISQRRGDGIRRMDDAIQLVTNMTRLVLKSLILRDTTAERERLAALGSVMRP